MSAPLEVLHVYSGNLFGGIESLILNLARFGSTCPELRQRFALCFEGRLFTELKVLGQTPVHLGETRLRKPISVIRSRKRFRDQLIQNRPHFVVTHSPWPHLIFGGVVKKEKIPLVYWQHGLTAGASWLDTLARRIRPDFAICNSHYSEKGLDRLFPGVQRKTLYAPIGDTSKLSARNTTRQTLGISDSTTLIVQVSRIEPLKGHRNHLRALALLKEDLSWKSIFVGGPQRSAEVDEFEKIQYEANQLGISDRVMFLGQRSDVPELLAASDIYFQPNESPEPFGVAVIEAMYSGLPVITTNFGGPAEVVTPSCGFLIRHGDIAGYASALKKLMSEKSLRDSHSKCAKDRASELCDPKKQMRLLYDTLQSQMN